MSATTEPKKVRHHERVLQHVRSNYGLWVAGGVLFIVAWLAWNTWIAAYVAGRG